MIFFSLFLVQGVSVTDVYQGSIHVQEGWNLVYGFIYTTQIASTSNVLASDIQAIYAFIPTKQTYARVYPNPSTTDLELLQSIDDDELSQTGFWVYTTKTGGLSYIIMDEPAPVDGRNMYPGWNFVGVTVDMIESPTRPNLTFTDLKGNCIVEKSAVFLDGQWVTLNPLPMEDNLLNSAVVIKVSKTCQLGTTSNTLLLPPSTP